MTLNVSKSNINKFSDEALIKHKHLLSLGNQMRGGNQGGPSPWQQGSVPQQQQQQFHPQQQQPQQQRQYQQPQMMQQQRQQQQPGNWGANPAWGNQSGQGNNHDFETLNVNLYQLFSFHLYQ